MWFVSAVHDFWASFGENMMAASAKIAVIAVAYLILRFIVLKLLNRLTKSLLLRVGDGVTEARQARLKALRSALRSGSAFVLGLIAIIMVLDAAGFDIVPILTTASVAGLAVGFGAQKLVRDVIAGLFILTEDQYGVGDFVSIGTATGRVEELGMRVTRLRDKSGRIWILSNGDIALVCNHSRGDFVLIHEVAVPLTEDTDKVRGVLDEVGRAIASDRPEMVKSPFACDGLTSVSGTAAAIRLNGVVNPWYQDEVKGELNARIREAFAKNDLRLA